MKTRDYTSYEDYLRHQVDKTRAVKDGTCMEMQSFADRKAIFYRLFSDMNLAAGGRAICLGARRGEEVAAMKELGIDAIGIDLVPFPPFVHKGDIHDIPVWDNSAGLVYSNSVDHVLDIPRFCKEITGVLIPGGVAILHLQIGVWSDEVANQLDSVVEIVDLCHGMTVLSSQEITPILGGINHLLVMRKK